MNLTAKDHNVLLRLASRLPKGSQERRAILAALTPQPTRRQHLVDGWASKYPQADVNLLAWLAHYSEANTVVTAAEMLAWDLGYEKVRSDLPDWFEKLGKQLRLDLQAKFDQGRAEGNKWR